MRTKERDLSDVIIAARPSNGNISIGTIWQLFIAGISRKLRELWPDVFEKGIPQATHEDKTFV